jgi:hypothetical protein
MSEDIKAQPESRWDRRLVIAAVLIFLASTTWNVATRINLQGDTTTSLDSIIQAQERVCLDNHELAAQYKVRGEAEKALFNFFLSLARQSLAESDDAASKDFLERFGPLARQIHILPLPDCQAQAERLRAELPPG